MRDGKGGSKSCDGLEEAQGLAQGIAEKVAG